MTSEKTSRKLPKTAAGMTPVAAVKVRNTEAKGHGYSVTSHEDCTSRIQDVVQCSRASFIEERGKRVIIPHHNAPKKCCKASLVQGGGSIGGGSAFVATSE